MPKLTYTRIAVIGALLIATLVGLVAASTAFASPDEEHAHPQQLSRESFRADMRELWEDHIVWTRQYIVSTATLPEVLPDTAPTAERLFRNQTDIGAAIAGFYGDAAGDQLTALLNDHIAIAAEVITIAKAGDNTATTAALERWYRNADDVAAFLAAANPDNWPATEMTAMMRDHLDHTLAEAVARLSGDYAADIAAYDRIHEQILHMADMLSDGIIDQFPARFAR
jgi:hypothetical protein